MRWTRAAGVGLFLVVLMVPHDASRAEPQEPTAGSPDEVLGRVAERVITRADVLRDLELAEGELEEAGAPRFLVALRSRAWTLVAAHLAEEARLAIRDGWVARYARKELARRAQNLSEKTGRFCTAQDVLSLLQMTRDAFERDLRLTLLKSLFGLHQLGGQHTIADDWEPAVEPRELRRLYETRWAAYQVRPGVRFVSVAVLFAYYLDDGMTREEAAAQRSRTTEGLAEALRDGVYPEAAARSLGLPPASVVVIGEGKFAEGRGISEVIGSKASEWLLDPARERGEVEVFSRLEDDFVLLFLERRPGREVPFEEVRERIENEIQTARKTRAVAALVLELAREPGFITPPRLAREVETYTIELLERCEPFVRAKQSPAPPLPTAVFGSFEAAIEEAATCGCLLYLHLDPTPEDARRVVSHATLERLAKRYVVAVVSGRIGDRVADRLRLRYGLMRPGAISLAIAPSGAIVDRCVPFEAEGALKAMQAAERVAVSAVPEAAARLCTQAEDEPALDLWFDPVLANVGELLSVHAWATNDTEKPLGRLRATVLRQGPRGPPRLVVLTMGPPHFDYGDPARARHEFRPEMPGWFHALAIAEGGPGPCVGARARVYVR